MQLLKLTKKGLIIPIKILKSISIIIGKHHNLENSNLPLFISTSLLGRSTGNLNATDFRKENELHINFDLLKIKEEDIKELEDIEIFRDWRNDKEFEINTKWNIKSHQYRRSLAVYSIQSGLVSLGGLQIQMKHLFKEMSLYYSNGASFAKKLFDIPKTHIANDIYESKHEINALSFIKNFILSDEKLFAVQGTFIERNIKHNILDKPTYLLMNRDKTIEQFKKGEIAFKETALGGCTSTEACDSRLTRSIIACINCDSGILKESKLNNVINRQEDFLKILDKNSIEYRTEFEDLKLLKDYQSKLIKDENGKK